MKRRKLKKKKKKKNGRTFSSSLDPDFSTPPPPLSPVIKDLRDKGCVWRLTAVFLIWFIVIYLFINYGPF